MKKVVLIAVALLLCGSFVVAGGGSEAQEGVVRVGFMPYYASVPLQVIEDENLDEKYGFEMETIMFPSGGPMAEALGAGEWDIGQIGAGGMIAIPNYDAKLVADVQYEMDVAWILARPDSAIVQAGYTLADWPEIMGSAATVEGATILGTVGNISHYMGIDYVQKFGLDMSEVNFIHMETAQVANAFIAGEGDIACMGDPSAAMALLDQGYVRIGGLKQQGVSQQDAMIVSAEYYENNVEDIKNFLKAWYEATDALNADFEYEKEMMAKFYTAGGRNVSDVAITTEAESCSYIDSTNYVNNVTGSWMAGLIECYVESGTMEKSTLDALRRNTKLEIVEEVLN